MTTRKEKHRDAAQAAAVAWVQFGFTMRGGWVFAPGAVNPVAQGFDNFQDWAIKSGTIYRDIYPHPEDHIWTWRVIENCGPPKPGNYENGGTR